MFYFSHKHDLNVINFYVILNGRVGNAKYIFLKCQCQVPMEDCEVVLL